MSATTRQTECNAISVAADERREERGRGLFVALELSNARWKLASTSDVAAPYRHKTIVAGDRVGLGAELARAKAKFGLAADAPVVSCYEAGRDGFGPHRLLTTLGVMSLVFDASSIEVPRRKRRVKTDRLDAAGLLRLLLRYHAGDRRAVAVVRVPSVETEDRRQLHREMETAKADRQRVRNRITSLVAAQGARLGLSSRFLRELGTVRCAEGRPLPPELQARLAREWALLEVLDQRVTALEAERHRRVVEAPVEDPEIARVRQLMTWLGIGETGAWVLVMEHYWRDFRNRREVGAAAGLTGTPYNSGDAERDQGIGKAGNGRVRTLAVELAWSWVRWQPQSALTRWFDDRFGASKRTRRVGIVAVARRLLIALWRFLETGEALDGAVLKPTKPTRKKRCPAVAPPLPVS